MSISYWIHILFHMLKDIIERITITTPRSASQPHLFFTNTFVSTLYNPTFLEFPLRRPLSHYLFHFPVNQSTDTHFNALLFLNFVPPLSTHTLTLYVLARL